MARLPFSSRLKTSFAERETPHRECIREMLSSIVSHRGSQTASIRTEGTNDPTGCVIYLPLLVFVIFPDRHFSRVFDVHRSCRSRCFSAVIPPRTPPFSRSINLFLRRSPIYLRSRESHRCLEKCNA